MNRIARALLLFATFLLIASPCLSKGPMTVDVSYAGYGYNTTVDTNDDGMLVNLSIVKGKGTFGHSDISITVEFEEPVSGDDPCADTYRWLPIVSGDGHYWASVLTAANHSQLFSVFDQGYLCLNESSPFDYYGMASGFYYGGTGCFENAQGQWTSHFEGVNLDESIGYRSIRGTIEGQLELP